VGVLPGRIFRREASGFGHYSELPLMFDWSIDPRSRVAALCLFTAFALWNNDILFFLFAMMAVCTKLGGQGI
jgi:hypothetical protein